MLYLCFLKSKEGNHIFLVDKNRVFYEPAIKIKEILSSSHRKIYVISAIHNLHVLNYDKKNTSKINYNYSSVFKDLTSPDAVVVQTKLQKKDIADRFAKGNVYAIPHTYEYDFFKEKNVIRDCYKAVYFARYSSEKRHELAIKAFAEVVKVIPYARFHCHGFGSTLAGLKKLIAELQLEDNIFLHGWCSNVDDEYESSCLSIISSQSESFSLTIAESLAHGCPVVCFDVPYGPRELVCSGINGYLVSYPDTYAMAEKIIKIMQNPMLQKKLSKHARISSKRYSKAVVAEQWRQVFFDIGVNN